VKPLVIKETNKTPRVVIDPTDGVIEIKGKSIPEDGSIFFNPILRELDRFGLNMPGNTRVNVQLEYFNTNSSKYIYQIFKKLEAMHRQDKPVQINWYYEQDDWDLQEAGEDYQSILKIPFKMIEIEGEEE